MGTCTAQPVLLFLAASERVIASFPLKRDQRPGMNRCLVWYHAASARDLDSKLRPMGEAELVRLLGPPDEETVLVRAARIDWT